jgi:DNA polymerase-1
MSAETLVLIDGHYYAYRYHFGMPALTGPGGHPTGVTYAFAELFAQMRARPEVTHLALVLDHQDPSFRHDIFPDYKAHRDPMPADLAAQLPDVERLARLSGIPVVCLSGFEADDCIAVLARRAEAAGMAVRILSKDKDLDQVLSEQVKTWDPAADKLRGPAELLAEKSLRPDQVIDYLCMVGDSADNVPGITGVGPKTAVKLLRQFGSLAAVLERRGELKGKQAEHVAAFVPLAELTRRLITIPSDVPGLPEPRSLLLPPLQDSAELQSFFGALGFKATRFLPTVVRQASDGADYRVLGAAEVPDIVAAIRAAGRCAVDTETTGLDPVSAQLVGISLAWGAADGRGAAYIPLQGTDHAALVPLAELHTTIGPLLADAAIGKIAQNAKYDLRILGRHGLPVQGLDGDPMLASWLLDPGRSSHGIDHLTRSFLHEEKIPTGAVIDLSAGQTMAQVPVATVARYACEDAQCAWRLAQLLESRLEAEGLLDAYRRQELPLAVLLAEIEDAGLAVDRSVLAEQQRHLEAYLAATETAIRSHAGADFNPASPKQVAEVLFGRLGLPVIRRTKTGPSTDASVLEALRHLHELPHLLLQHRSLSKLVASYLRTLPDCINSIDGRIHTSLKQTGTETGRLSSEQPNLQNIPKRGELGREIRAAFVAGPQRLFLAADYSQIELRILAHLSGDPGLKAAFAADRDIHRMVAAEVNGVAEELVTPEMRSAAKAVNFGIIYGQTAFGLSQELGIPRDQAQRFIDGYFARFPAVRSYIAGVVAEATSRGFVQTLAGRRRWVPGLTSGNRNERMAGERVALNSTIQGSAADLIKSAMLRCRSLLPTGARLVLQIHDELLVETPAELADAAAAALHEAMTTAAVLSVPLTTEVRRGPHWLAVS